MTQFLRPFFAFLLTALCFVSSTAHAATAQDYLEAKQKELTVLIKQPKSAANDQKLTLTFDALLDYDAFAKNSLVDEWASLSPAQRDEFKSLLTTLVQRSYTKNIRDTLDYNITFKGESEAKAGKLVRSVAKHKTDARKESVHIDYLVHQVGGKWRVYDIITEGESLVGNYTNQFRRVIKKDGFSGLIAKMRKKADEG